jgi:hypothetical protein
MEPQGILFIIAMALLYWFALFTIPTLLVKRAAAQVIAIIRAQGATSAQRAKTIDELGLRPPGFPERIIRLRDYKPAALTFLMSAGVIAETADGKVYLSEGHLKALCEKDKQNRLGLHELVRD